MPTQYSLRLATCVFLVCSAAFASCQRASYSFQPAPGSAARAETPPPPAMATDLAPATTAATPETNPRPKQPRRAERQQVRRHACHAAPARRPAVVPVRRLLRLVARPVLATRSVAAPEPAPVRYRSKGIALLFAVLGGYFGLHRFYLGYPGAGAGYLGLLLAGYIFLLFGALLALGTGGVLNGPLIMAVALNSALLTWLIIDIVRIIMGRLKPKGGEYNPGFFQTRPAAPAPAPAAR